MPIDSQAIIAEVRANKAKLDGCSKHFFVRINRELLSKYVCFHCKGQVNSIDAYWYNKGMEHAKK